MTRRHDWAGNTLVVDGAVKVDAFCFLFPLKFESQAFKGTIVCIAARSRSQEIQVPRGVCRERKVECSKEMPCSNYKSMGFDYDAKNNQPSGTSPQATVARS